MKMLILSDVAVFIKIEKTKRRKICSKFNEYNIKFQFKKEIGVFCCLILSSGALLYSTIFIFKNINFDDFDINIERKLIRKKIVSAN